MDSTTFMQLCRARDMMRQAPQHRNAIADLAAATAMSRFQFIRRFRALFGVTPHRFLIDVRIDRAKSLLAITDHSIMRVCLDVGFVSLGSFSALFSRRVGMSPSAYRRRARSMQSAPRTQPRELVPGCLSLMTMAFAISEKSPRCDGSYSAP